MDSGGEREVALRDLEEAAALVVDDEEAQHADTLGGLVMAKLGRLPQGGDMVTVGGRRLRVETVQRRRVARARLLPSTRVRAATDVTPA
jgi:CBS domain containing-hemolysin-like protein